MLAAPGAAAGSEPMAGNAVDPPLGGAANVVTALGQMHSTCLRQETTDSRREVWSLLLACNREESSCSALKGKIYILPIIASFLFKEVLWIESRGLSAFFSFFASQRYGFVARSGPDSMTLTGLQVLSFTMDKETDDAAHPEDVQEKCFTNVLSLVARHCTDLRALRLYGSGGDGGEVYGSSDDIDQILNNCPKLRILSVSDWSNYFPKLNGVHRQLTYLHVDTFFNGGPATQSVAAFLADAPNLEHLSINYNAEDPYGMDYLAAVAASNMANLRTVDLRETSTIADQLEPDEYNYDIATIQGTIVNLPKGLRFTVPAHFPYEEPAEMYDHEYDELADILEKAIGTCQRQDLTLFTFDDDQAEATRPIGRSFYWGFNAAAANVTEFPLPQPPAPTVDA